MSVRDARDDILREHEELRAAVAGIEALVVRFERGELEEESLREAARSLYTRLVAHLALEDRLLVPSLRDVAGQDVAERLSRDHAEQRSLLGYLIGRLVPEAAPPALVASDLRQFLTLLHTDMDSEERLLDEAITHAHGERR